MRIALSPDFATSTSGLCLAVALLWPLALAAQDDDCSRPTFTLRWNHGFGTALASLGDLDGDGVEDHAVGAPGRPEEEDVGVEGAVHIISGRASVPLFRISGGGAGDEFGRTLAAAPARPDGPAGTLTGRLYVGAPCWQGGRGRVVAYAVRATGAQELFHVDGADAGELLGFALSAVPSGGGMLVIGAPGSNANGPRRGRVLLLNPQGTLRSEFFGAVDFAGHGVAVAVTTDVNGDGAPDILVGSQDPRPAGNSSGQVTIRSLDGELLAHLNGNAGERLGGVLVPIDDLDGDSFNDIVVSAAGFPRPLPCTGSGLPACSELDLPPNLEPGKVYILRGGARAIGLGGTLGAVLRTVTDSEPGAYFGASIVGVDDLDGDGLKEIGVGSPYSSFHGKTCSGRVDIFQGSNGKALWTWGGTKRDDRLGFAMTSLEDQNGDQVGDLLVARRRQEGETSLFSLGDKDGNGRRDACQPCAVSSVLEVGRTESFTLTRVSRLRCFRFEPQPGASLRLFLESDAAEDSAKMVLRWGAPPLGSTFDQARDDESAAFPGILVRSAPNQPGYVQIEARQLGTPTGSFRLSLEVIDGPILQGITPSQSSAAPGAKVLCTVLGLAFPPRIAFRLQPIAGRAPALNATEIQRLSPGRVDAQFDLSTAPQGMYDLVAILDGVEVATLAKAFTVTTNKEHEVGKVSVLGPGLYRNNTIARLTLRLENFGSRPMPPPLFQIVGPPGSLFGFSRSRQTFTDSVLGLGRSRATPDGSIPPGGKVDVSVWFRRLFLPDECPPDTECLIQFDVRILDPRAKETIDWENAPAPAGVAAETWEEALPAFSQLGPSWTHYYEALVGLATLRAQRGQLSTSLLPPFELGLQRALGLPTAAITGVVRDGNNDLPVPQGLVVALLNGEPVAHATTNSNGYFVLDRLESNTLYRLEIVEPRTGRVFDSTRPDIQMPDRGDVRGVEIRVERTTTGQILTPACPACEAAPAPTAPMIPPPTMLQYRTTFETKLISSFDPNDKNGSGTQGGDTEIDPGEAIEYRIDFENTQRGESGAAARYVEVVDKLRSDLDWTTVELLEVAIESQPEPIFVAFSGDDGGELQDLNEGSGLPVDPSDRFELNGLTAGVALWSGPIEYQHGHPEKTVDVDLRIVATVEPSGEAFLGEEESGVVSWTFEQTNKLVPEEGETEEEFRRKGFLAFDCPDGDDDAASTPCGGHVSFTILPRAAIADGTVVTNDAEIIFDLNAAELTEPPVELTIETQGPGVPESPNPSTAVDSPPVDGNSLSLAWRAAYADSFDVYLWRSSEGEARPLQQERTIVWELGVPVASFPTTESWLSLSPGVEYRWQVIARNDRGETAAGPVWRFATLGDSTGFRRGDADINARLEITDAVRCLEYLFLGGSSLECLDAADTDDSGVINITDPILTLAFLFLGGAEIPAPGPETCGSDASGDELGCGQYSSCQ